MINEGELRELLKPLILELYGLTAEKPEVQPAPTRRTPRPRERVHATFSNPGATVAKGRSVSESSAIPGRQKILVGTSVRLADKQRSSPGARIPGESDRDYLDRRRSIRADHRRGLGAPKSDVVRRGSTDEYWEMGH